MRGDVMSFINNSPEVSKRLLKKTFMVYSEYIHTYGSHIERLRHDGIIDRAARDNYISELGAITSELISEYSKHSETPTYASEIEENEELDQKLNLLLFEYVKNNKKNYQPFFEETRTQLINLSNSYGAPSCLEYFRILLGPHCYLLLEPILDNFSEYSIFISHEIKINNINKVDNASFLVNATKCDFECIFDNSCDIKIKIPYLDDYVIFSGYIPIDPTNVIVRTFSNHNMRINEMRNTAMAKYGKDYVKRYEKYTGNHILYIYNLEGYLKKIQFDGKKGAYYAKMDQKKLIDDFRSESISSKYNIIRLLIIEKKYKMAAILFELIKSKVAQGYFCVDIMVRNFTVAVQNELIKQGAVIHREIQSYKNIKYDNVTIQQRLAIMDHIPRKVKEHILKLLMELESSDSAYKAQIAIDGLIQFPWKNQNDINIFKEINKNVASTRKFLSNLDAKFDEYVYGLKETKKAIMELAGKWIANPDASGQAIGLVGPPGMAKTLFAKSVGEALGIPLRFIALGGMSDSSDLMGHGYTYTNSQCGIVIRQMIDGGKWRTIILFDEVDKVSEKNGTNDIHNSLIHLIDPTTNGTFRDRFYSNIDFDLSGVLFIFSYNDSEKISPILRDRIKEIKIKSGYSREEKVVISQKHLIPNILNDIKMKKDKFHFADNTVKYIIDKYTHEGGVRELKRRLEDIMMKINLERFECTGPFEKLKEKNCDNIFNLDFDEIIEIDEELVIKYLGKSRVTHSQIGKEDAVGVVNGLYVTSIGTGGIMPIQAKISSFGALDQSNLILTGSQKDVMRESVKCALQVAVAIVNPDKNHNYHIHVTETAVGKDGPSAGSAFATAIVSLLLDKPVNRFVGMTGEIDINGGITAIGGLQSKLIGAKAAGVTLVFVPEDNRNDFEEALEKDEKITSDLEVVFVTHISQIINDERVMKQ